MRAQEVRPQVMHHHVRQEVTDRRAAFVGRLPDDTQMHVSVILPLRNQASMNGLLQRLYDRSSSDYHHFLTVAGGGRAIQLSLGHSPRLHRAGHWNELGE
jgi:hypothetical protein